MKKLLFAIITGLFISCSNSVEPTTQDQQQITGKIHITTLLMEHKQSRLKSVLYSGSKPDTILPVYEHPQPIYTKVDSIWGFYTDVQNGQWQVRVNDGMPSHWNIYGSVYGQNLIKKWER